MRKLKLYQRDFYAWTQQQAKFIKEQAFDKLDIINLFEEVADMGKHEKRELANRLTVLLTHLLKWQYQPDYINKKSWLYTIKEQRKQIKYHLEDNPSLKNNEHMHTTFFRAYDAAIYEAAKETNLDERIFPPQCTWSITQVLDDDFLPN